MGKNHSTNKERSHTEQKKARKWRNAKTANEQKQRHILDQAKAYWRGEADHPKAKD